MAGGSTISAKFNQAVRGQGLRATRIAGLPGDATGAVSTGFCAPPLVFRPVRLGPADDTSVTDAAVPPTGGPMRPGQDYNQPPTVQPTGLSGVCQRNHPQSIYGQVEKRGWRSCRACRAATARARRARHRAEQAGAV